MTTEPLLTDAIRIKVDAGDGVKLVVPLETVPEALPDRLVISKLVLTISELPIWKCPLSIERRRGLAPLQVTLTETGNVLPDTLSDTEMVALRVAENRLELTCKLGVDVEPKADSNTAPVQLLN